MNVCLIDRKCVEIFNCTEEKFTDRSHFAALNRVGWQLENWI